MCTRLTRPLATSCLVNPSFFLLGACQTGPEINAPAPARALLPMLRAFLPRNVYSWLHTRGLCSSRPCPSDRHRPSRLACPHVRRLGCVFPLDPLTLSKSSSSFHPSWLPSAPSAHLVATRFFHCSGGSPPAVDLDVSLSTLSSP